MWIQGYYPVYRIGSLPIANIPWSKLTHIGYFNIDPNSTGGFTYPNGTLLTNMATLVNTAHANDTKVLVVVGGQDTGGADARWRACISSTYRATFVATLAAYVSDNNLDGIDLDWEPFSTESDGTNFALFVADLRAALGATKVITMFLTVNEAWKRTLCNNIEAYIDQFGMSTYDLSYGNSDTVHDSPLYHFNAQPDWASADAAATAFAAAGVVKAKLCIAVPQYSHRWTGATGLYTSPGYFDPGLARNYNSIPGASATTPPTGEIYDATNKGAYLNGAPFESYNNVATVQAKVDYVNAQGLGGIIIWELGQGYFSGQTPEHPLLEPFAGQKGVGGGGSGFTTIKRIGNTLVASVKSVRGRLIAAINRIRTRD